MNSDKLKVINKKLFEDIVMKKFYEKNNTSWVYISWKNSKEKIPVKHIEQEILKKKFTKDILFFILKGEITLDYIDDDLSKELKFELFDNQGNLFAEGIFDINTMMIGDAIDFNLKFKV